MCRKPGDLVRVTITRSSGDDTPVVGIITKSLGGIGWASTCADDPMWFNVMIEGKIEAVNEGEISLEQLSTVACERRIRTE